MPRKRFTNQQIAFALRQVESGATVDEVCRKMGISCTEPIETRQHRLLAPGRTVGKGSEVNTFGGYWIQQFLERKNADGQNEPIFLS